MEQVPGGNITFNSLFKSGFISKQGTLTKFTWCRLNVLSYLIDNNI